MKHILEMMSHANYFKWSNSSSNQLFRYDRLNVTILLDLSDAISQFSNYECYLHLLYMCQQFLSENFTPDFNFSLYFMKLYDKLNGIGRYLTLNMDKENTDLFNSYWYSQSHLKLFIELYDPDFLVE